MGRAPLALFPFDLNIWYGAVSQGVVINDWADDNFDHSGLGFIGGASLTVNHEVHPEHRFSTFGQRLNSLLFRNVGAHMNDGDFGLYGGSSVAFCERQNRGYRAGPNPIR